LFGLFLIFVFLPFVLIYPALLLIYFIVIWVLFSPFVVTIKLLVSLVLGICEFDYFFLRLFLIILAIAYLPALFLTGYIFAIFVITISKACRFDMKLLLTGNLSAILRCRILPIAFICLDRNERINLKNCKCFGNETCENC
jgi:hypothetical protein